MATSKTTSTDSKELSPKVIFNALSNATHIFAFKEDNVEFKILKIVDNEDTLKAVVQTNDGELTGLFTDSKSAIDALNEVWNVFEDFQPVIRIKMKTTAKGASIYYVEIV